MKCPYTVLGVPKDATKKTIKKAYYKLSLEHHPDKHGGDDAKFKDIVVAYTTLTKHREAYDNGQAPDEKTIWEKWDELDKMKDKYQGSEQEAQDIIAAYKTSKGKMEEIFNLTPFVTLEDEKRIVEIVQNAVKDGLVRRYKAFFEESESSKRKRRKVLEDEEEEAEIAQKELIQHMKIRYGVEESLEGKDLEDLAVILKEKQKSSWHSMLDNMAEKYGNLEDDEVIDFSKPIKKKKKKKK